MPIEKGHIFEWDGIHIFYIRHKVRIRGFISFRLITNIFIKHQSFKKLCQHVTDTIADAVITYIIQWWYIQLDLNH